MKDWWAISGDELMLMLEQARYTEPSVVYAEWYANSEVESA